MGCFDFVLSLLNKIVPIYHPFVFFWNWAPELFPHVRLQGNKQFLLEPLLYLYFVLFLHTMPTKLYKPPRTKEQNKRWLLSFLSLKSAPISGDFRRRRNT